MERKSVNGILVPTDVALSITEEYLGHFLKVSYILYHEQTPIYEKSRVEVNPDGTFRFFVPLQELIQDQMVTIEVYAPDGEMLRSQRYSYGNLYTSNYAQGTEDESGGLLKIGIDPKILTFDETSPEVCTHKKINGKIIDISGTQNTAGLQVLILTSNSSTEEFSFDTFETIFSSITDDNGSFYGSVENRNYQQAYGIIAGLSNNPIKITLESKKVPYEVLLATDMSLLSDDSTRYNSVPSNPNGDELVNSSKFSQDLGTGCVDFTTPNRSLEEVSFYHAVRTTEPEIKGFTIQTKNLRKEFHSIASNLIDTLTSMNTSFHSMSLLEYAVNEDEENEATTELRSLTPNLSKNTLESNYKLRLVSPNQNLQFSMNQLVFDNKRYGISHIFKLLAQQAKRKKKLQQLHQKLAMAYCGKYGVEEEKTFCEQFAQNNIFPYDTLSSITAYLSKLGRQLTPQIRRNSIPFIFAMDKIKDESFISKKSIEDLIKKTQTFKKSVEKQSDDITIKEELLEYLNKLEEELKALDLDTAKAFEPCPPDKIERNSGIMCVIQEFKKTKEILDNQVVFTLDNIITIRTNYQLFLKSISSFLNLLEEFYTFYNASELNLISLEDDYFVKNYKSIKNTLLNLKRRINYAIIEIEKTEQEYISNHPGRKHLSSDFSIDWDETPTVYENTTIAHGHILHFKQQWKADGYSLGDLLYSLPLAPCQEKNIAILDWDRDEFGRRNESQDFSDTLQASISRDRDINEIVNSTFRENINASSHNDTSSTSGGIGGGIGGFIGKAVFGISGGVSSSGSSSNSSSSQDSSRNLSASALNSLQDNIFQSASNVKKQRSTVVQTVNQAESVSIQTEVVKNNNHCHSITMEYFEVLKHYAIEQKLVDVQECLFIPLPMSHFDNDKVLRWKNTLKRNMYGTKLLKGFDAIERIESGYANSDFPDEAYCTDKIHEFSGFFVLTFDLVRPYIQPIEDETKIVKETIELGSFFPWFGRVLEFTYDKEVPLTKEEKDAIFEKDYAPDIVKSFIEELDFYAVTDKDHKEIKLDLDVTIASTYKKGHGVYVNIASASTDQTITREDFKHLIVRASTEVKSGSRINLNSVVLSYRTDHMRGNIINKRGIRNDIINTKTIEVAIDEFPGFKQKTVTDAALFYTPMNYQELRNPRNEDREAAIALVEFLNEHLEMAHKAIWSSMDSSRIFGLLDGYIAPNAKGKSVASVVENKLIGIIGNNLLFKVVDGQRLDPTFKNVKNLFEHYRPTTKPDPFRISVPTKGVYAESVMGKCVSCEKIDESLHWRFKDEPCGTKATAIEPLSSQSRKSDVGDLQTKDFPTSIINLQNAPSAPDPTGLSAAYSLLGKGDSFKDMTGLSGTQQNALNALQTTSKSVTDLASISKDFANLSVMANQNKDASKQIEQIKKAHKEKYLSDSEASNAIKEVLDIPVKAAKSINTNTNDTAATQVANQLVAQGKKAMDSGYNFESSVTSPDGGSTQAKYSVPSEKKTVQNVSKTSPLSQIKAPGTNPGSTIADALFLITEFGNRTGDLKFNVTRNQIVDDLTHWINHPDLLDQNKLNLCGPAATLYCVMQRDPKMVCKFVIDLVENGKGKFGTRTVNPDSDLKNQTIKDWGPTKAQWIAMCSLRDDENWFFDYEGTPEEDVSAATTPGEVQDWLMDTGLYTTIIDEANLVVTESLSHLQKLKLNNNTDNILLIHAYLLKKAKSANKKSDDFITNAFPNHFVVLKSDVVVENDIVKFTVWTWGKDDYDVEVPIKTFNANYYGAVIATV